MEASPILKTLDAAVTHTPGSLPNLARIKEAFTGALHKIPEAMQAPARRMSETLKGPANRILEKFDALGIKRALAHPGEALDIMLGQAPSKASMREWKQIKAVFNNLQPGKRVSAVAPVMNNGRVNIPRLEAFNKRLQGITGKESNYVVRNGRAYFELGAAAKTSKGKNARRVANKANGGGKGKRNGAAGGGGFGFGFSNWLGSQISAAGNHLDSKGWSGFNKGVMQPWARGLKSKKDYMPWLAGTLYGAYNAYSMIAPGDQPLAIG